MCNINALFFTMHYIDTERKFIGSKELITSYVSDDFKTNLLSIMSHPDFLSNFVSCTSLSFC